jgi:hypothetical protein
VKKGEQPEFSARWWKSSQPKGLKSADRLEGALKDYETAKKKLEAGGDANAVKSAEAALGGVETAVSAVSSEAAKDKKSPEMAITVDVLKKFDRLYRVEQAWIEDQAEEDDDSAFGDPDAYHEYLIGAMKRLRSSGTMNFGFVLGKKAEDHRLAVHRSKGAKALANTLVKETGLHAMTFGTAMPDANRAGVLVLVLEGRQLPGMQKKGARMLKKFKPLPFTKLAVMVDGQEVEDLDDPEDTDVDEPDEVAAEGAPAETPDPAVSPATPPPSAADGGAPPPDTTTATAAPSPAVPRTPAPGADTGALTARVTSLVNQLIPLTAGDPARLAVFKKIAVAAQTALKSGDFVEAVKAADALQAILGTPAAAPAGSAANGARPNGAAPPDPAAAQKVAKSRLAWLATRKKIETDLGKLKSVVMTACQGIDIESALEAAFRERVEPVLEQLDESLAHKLDEVNGSADAAQRAKLVAEAKGIIKRYEAFATGSQIIAKLDDNPFFPLTISKTLAATLGTLSSAIR